MIGRDLILRYAPPLRPLRGRAPAALLAGAAATGLGVAALWFLEPFGGVYKAPASDGAPVYTESASLTERDRYLYSLKVGYRRLADRSTEHARFAMARDFSEAADRLPEVRPVLMASDEVAYRHERLELDEWRTKLEAAFIGGLPARAPEAAAEAHLAYDCVVRASHPDGARDIREICIAEFEAAMRMIKALDAPPPRPTPQEPDLSSLTVTRPPSTVEPDVAFDPLAPDAVGVGAGAIETGAIAPPAPEPASTETPPPRPASPPRPRLPDGFDGPAVGVALFDVGSTQIDFAARRALLDVLAEALRQAEGGRVVTILVAGHADAVGDHDDNEWLSSARAASAATVLEKRRDEIVADPALRARLRIVTAHFGETAPVAGAGAPSSHDRRVELYIRTE